MKEMEALQRGKADGDLSIPHSPTDLARRVVVGFSSGPTSADSMLN